jgi:S1-C subfamily serine protease
MGGASVVQRPWRGAKLQAVTAEIAEGLGLKRPAGALVANVTAKSPAARGGLKTGDLVTAIDGQPVDDPNAFDYRFATKPLGGSAQVSVLRSGREAKLSIALESAPDSARDEVVIRSRSPFGGCKVANLTPALADQFHIDPSANGVVVVDIAERSAAAGLGFQKGDIVLAVNGTPIEKTADLVGVTEKQSRLWRITIQRAGKTVSVVFGG